ncbi:MAG: FAD-dependent oxidoreductase, partial [Bacteroidota bacterium]|nr:FAD-dependent oxidoreductase [Bacteroidota bacterium]
LHGNKATAILTPKNGLSELLINPAEIYLRKYDSEIKVSESVKGLVVSNNKIVEVLTDKSNYKDFDAVISAVPYEAINKIVKLGSRNFLPEYSSIVSIQVKLQNNPLNDDYYALVNSPIHWVFNNKTHLSLVISGADGFSNLPKEQISAIAKEELAKYFSISEDNISGTTVIKEKRATYVPKADFISNRPGSFSHIDNLILAGDWIDTRLPCTIESAVKSGYLAAGIVKRVF